MRLSSPVEMTWLLVWKKTTQKYYELPSRVKKMRCREITAAHKKEEMLCSVALHDGKGFVTVSLKVMQLSAYWCSFYFLHHLPLKQATGPASCCWVIIIVSPCAKFVLWQSWITSHHLPNIILLTLKPISHRLKNYTVDLLFCLVSLFIHLKKNAFSAKNLLSYWKQLQRQL